MLHIGGVGTRFFPFFVFFSNFPIFDFLVFFFFYHEQMKYRQLLIRNSCAIFSIFFSFKSFPYYKQFFPFFEEIWWRQLNMNTKLMNACITKNSVELAKYTQNVKKIYRWNLNELKIEFNINWCQKKSIYEYAMDIAWIYKKRIYASQTKRKKYTSN